MKYPRTHHWPTSGSISNDDKVLKDARSFLGVPVVVTEKLDGGCTLIKPGQVFARSVYLPTTCPSFDYIKQSHLYKSYNWNPDLDVYGENLYACHTIYYDQLTDFFYTFGVKEDNEWYSFDDLELFCEAYEIPIAPVVIKTIFNTEQEVTKFFENELKKPSFFGITREGFVMRKASSFLDKDFKTSVCKYVRPDHVGSDQHWSKNWIPNKLRVK